MTDTRSLKKKASSGIIWTSIRKYSSVFIGFISGIILARLLEPSDYGCIGMLAIFMALARIFVDGGFGSALIQRKNPSQDDYSTIFWWNIVMSVVMYALLFVFAPTIANYYNIPLLSDVLRVQAIVLFFYAFSIVQRNLLKKKLNFKILSIVSLSTSVIAIVTTIIMAYKGYGVWALVAQNMINAAIPTIVYWIYVKWRPRWIFSWHSFKELFGFGFYMFLTNLLNSFGQQIQGLLIGRQYNATTMGFYSKALKTESLASHSVSSVMTEVTYPLYAEAQDDKVKLSNMIRRLTMTLSYATFPIMFILILCARPLFIFLYSERWINSIPYFQVLCIAGLASCLISVNTQPIAAIGKSKLMFVWTVIKRSIGIGCIVLGMKLWGMRGLLIGVLINMYFAYFVNILLVSKYIGYKWYRQILDLLPIAIVAIVAALLSFLVGQLLDLPLYAEGAVKMVTYTLIYVGWSLIFKPEAYTYCLSSIPERFRFWERGWLSFKK